MKKQILHRTKWLGFFMALIFIIGIGAETALAPSFENCVEQQQQEHKKGESNVGGAFLSQTESIHGVDDFQLMTQVQGDTETEEESTYTAIRLVIVVLAFVLSCVVRARYTIQVAENRRTTRWVISFIHRTDGKKKNPVMNHIIKSKQEVLGWKLEQNTKYYLSTRRRKYSII